MSQFDRRQLQKMQEVIEAFNQYALPLSSWKFRKNLVMRMVLLTLDSARKVFLDVIEGTKSFEEASNWASDMIEKDERGLLQFDPSEEMSKIFSALTYLTGLDLTEPSGEYFHSISNVKDEYNEIFLE